MGNTSSKGRGYSYTCFGTLYSCSILMRIPSSHSMVKMKNMARSPYLHPRRMRRGVRQSARGQPERHSSARDPQRADLEGRSRTWDGLDSGIPAGRAAFTVLKSTYVNRMRSELDDVDLKSFGLVIEDDTLTSGWSASSRSCGAHACSARASPASTRTTSRTRRSTRATQIGRASCRERV